MTVAKMLEKVCNRASRMWKQQCHMLGWRVLCLEQLFGSSLHKALQKGSPEKGYCLEQVLFLRMSKWKRKKEEPAPEPEEEMSPLAICLLEHYAQGMSVSWNYENVC